MRLNLVILLIMLFGAIGWGLNISKLIGMNFDAPITGMLIVRAVGIFMAPLGAVLGYL